MIFLLKSEREVGDFTKLPVRVLRRPIRKTHVGGRCDAQQLLRYPTTTGRQAAGNVQVLSRDGYDGPPAEFCSASYGKWRPAFKELIEKVPMSGVTFTENVTTDNLKMRLSTVAW